jgi:hypothetical protein
MDAELFGKEGMYQFTWEVGGNVAIRAMGRGQLGQVLSQGV